MPALLLTNIGQLLTLQGPPWPRRGRELGEVGVLEDAAVLCHGGKIVTIGKRRDAERDSWLKSHKKKVEEIDCRGGVVLPGFVDSHTHPAFAAPRLVDFEKRIGGATYEQIAAAGGSGGSCDRPRPGGPAPRPPPRARTRARARAVAPSGP